MITSRRRARRDRARRSPLRSSTRSYSRSSVARSRRREANADRTRIDGGVPRNALAPPFGGSQASPSFGGIGSTQSLGDRRSSRLLVGLGASGARGPAPSALSRSAAGASYGLRRHGSGWRQGRRLNRSPSGTKPRLEGASEYANG